MYYFYTTDGQMEGPVSMEVLEDYYNQKKITATTTVFQEGEQEGEEFAVVRFRYRLLHNAKSKASSNQTPSSTTLIGYYFPIVGGFIAVAGIIGFCVALDEEMVGIGVACLLSGFFSLMLFVWMGKIYDRISECVLLLKNMQNNNK